MSRSGYTDECDGPELDLYRGAVNRAITGSRGQAFLRELLAALDAMDEKVLIADELVNDEGDVCTIGSVGRCRSLDMYHIDYEDSHAVARAFGIARSMAAEIEFMNDEWSPGESPESRYDRMRRWVAKQIIPTADELLPLP